MSNNSKVENILKNSELKDLDLEDLIIIAQRATKDLKVQVLNYEINDYFPHRTEYLASHHSLHITIQRSDSKISEKLKFFVKGVLCEYKHQTECLKNDGVFAKEATFYQSVIPILTEEYTDEKWYPEYYLVKNELIVMEDLQVRNYEVSNRLFDDATQLKSILTTMARFHSCSILAEARLSQQSKRHITLQELYPEKFKETLLVRSGKLGVWMSNGIKLISVLVNHYGLKSEKLPKIFESIYDVIQPSKIHRNVVGHADLWKNNLMLDNTNPVPKSVLVDFQMFRYGPIALDVIQVLYLNTSRKYRAKFEKELIEFYHSMLEKTVRSCDTTNSAIIPTLEELLFSIDDLRVYGAISSCLYYPFVSIDQKVMLKVMADSTKGLKTSEDFRFGSRVVDAIMTFLEKNESFENTVKDLITEFVEICEKKEI